MMKFLSKNIIAAIWALILGEVLAYITSQLEGMTPDYMMVGWISVIMGLIAVNCVEAITAHANPSRNDD